MTKPSEARKIARKIATGISFHSLCMDDGSCEVAYSIEKALLSYGKKRFKEGVRRATAKLLPLLPKGKGE